MAMMGRLLSSTIAASTTISLICRSSHMHRSSAIFCRQMSSAAEDVVMRLKSSGLLRSQGLIAGKWTEAYDKKVIEVTNPATGDVVSTVPCMGAKETNDAISAAYETFSKIRRYWRLESWFFLL